MITMYKEIKKAKNGMPVPIFYDSQAMHSLYNPAKEGESFFPEIHNTTNFFIILGIGGGYHINSLLQRNPDSFFLLLENNIEDLTLCRTIPLVKKLENKENIKFCSISNLANNILENYIPVFYNTISILKHHFWTNKNKENLEKITTIINGTIDKISSDISTQSFFGKIWNSNILNNLKLCSSTKYLLKNPSFPHKKTAAVIAAGPSLDSTYRELLNHRDNYYIISTDTSFTALNKRKIISDCVISIDGQNLSCKHYEGKIQSSTLFIFDLCSSPSAVEHVLNSGASILFTISGHPLATYASKIINNFNSSFIQLYPGAGTVTIAACDFAYKAGFSKLAVFGADFAYSKGKSYTQGTYLDDIYLSNSNHLNTSETNFTKLFYRTPLIYKKTSATTKLLNSYKEALFSWLNKYYTRITKDNFIITANSTNSDIKFHLSNNFSYSLFLKKFKKDILLSQNAGFNKITPVLYTLFPYIAYLKQKEKNSVHDLLYFINIAYSNILGYN